MYSNDWRDKLERARRRREEIEREKAKDAKRRKEYYKIADAAHKQAEIDRKAQEFLDGLEKKKKQAEEEIKQESRIRYRKKILLGKEAMKELANPDYHFSEDNRASLMDLYFPTTKNWVYSERSEYVSGGVETQPIVFRTSVMYDQDLVEPYSATSSTSIYFFDAVGKFVRAVCATEGLDSEFEHAVFFAPKSHAVFPTGHISSIMGKHEDVIEAIVIHAASLPSWVYSCAFVTEVSTNKTMSIETGFYIGEKASDADIKTTTSPKITKDFRHAAVFVRDSDLNKKGTIVSAVLRRSGPSWYHENIGRGYLGETAPHDLFKHLGWFPCPQLPEHGTKHILPESAVGKQFNVYSYSASLCALHVDKAGNILDVHIAPKKSWEGIEITEETSSIVFAYLSEYEQEAPPSMHVSLHVPEHCFEDIARVGTGDVSSTEEDLHLFYHAITIVAKPLVRVRRPDGCLFPLAVVHRAPQEWSFHAIPQDSLGIKVGEDFAFENANEQQLHALLKICMGELVDVTTPDNNIVDIRFDGQSPDRDIRFPQRAALCSEHFQFEARYPGSKFSVVAYNMLGKPVPHEMIQAHISEWATSKSKANGMKLSINESVAKDRQVKDILQGKLPSGANSADCLPTTLKIFVETPERFATIQRFRWTTGSVDIDAIGPTSFIVRGEKGVSLFNVDIICRDNLTVGIVDNPTPNQCLTVKSVSLEMSARNLKALDIGGSSDPFVKGTVSVTRENQSTLSTPFKTKVIDKNLSPNWGRVLLVDVASPGRVTLECTLFDKDIMGQEEIGRVSLDITHLLDPSVAEVEGVERKWFEIPLESPKSKDPVGKRGTLLLRAHKID